MQMEQPNGGLKDIFSTILNETPPRAKPVPHIVVHGDGNVIAPGGTVHVTHTRPSRKADSKQAP